MIKEEKMKGRLEHELKNEEKIRVLLSDMPDFIKEWEQNMKACGRTTVTRIDYLYRISLYLKHINENMRDIEISELSFISAQGFFVSMYHINRGGETVESSDTYKCQIWSAMKSMFGYFLKRGYIEKNPMDMIDCPVNHDRERIREKRMLLNATDFRKILKAVNNERTVALKARNRAVLLLFMTTGMRKTALTEINVEDINMRTRTLVVTDKRKKTHVYYLGNSTVEAIREWKLERECLLTGKQSSDALFIDRSGERIGVYAVNYIVGKYTKKALGKTLTAHKLRGGYINVLYGVKHDLNFVCKAVGHSSVTTTALYLDAAGNERKKARDLMEKCVKVVEGELPNP